MKTVFVLPLILIAIGIATWLHVSKKNGNYIEDDIDQLAEATKRIEQAVPQHTSLAIRQYSVDDFLWCRYLLAPHHCSIDPAEKLDTIFSICKTDAPDSILHVIKAHQKLLLEYKDAQYQYFLTCNHQ